MCLTATRASRLNQTRTRLKAKQEELKQGLNHRFSFSFAHVSTLYLWNNFGKVAQLSRVDLVELDLNNHKIMDWILNSQNHFMKHLLLFYFFKDLVLGSSRVSCFCWFVEVYFTILDIHNSIFVLILACWWKTALYANQQWLNKTGSVLLSYISPDWILFSQLLCFLTQKLKIFTSDGLFLLNIEFLFNFFKLDFTYLTWIDWPLIAILRCLLH